MGPILKIKCAKNTFRISYLYFEKRSKLEFSSFYCLRDLSREILALGFAIRCDKADFTATENGYRLQIRILRKIEIELFME